MKNGFLQPIREGMELMGAMVVPGSSLIVGARLYAYSRESNLQTEPQPTSPSPTTPLASPSPSHVDLERATSIGAISPRDVRCRDDLTFGEVSAMVATRFLVMPMFGLLLVRVANWFLDVDDELLLVYMSMPFYMPTASNLVVMVQMASERNKEAGSRMERALLRIMFWQYAVAPLFLTMNVGLSLESAMNSVL